MLGEVAWLMAHSDLHRQWPVGALQQWVSTPFRLGQFRIYHRRDGQPVGFLSWAEFSEDAEKRYLEDCQTIAAEDWNSGDRLWVIDFIAPFGHGRKIMDDMSTNLFPGRTGKALRLDKKGTMRVIEMTGRKTTETKINPGSAT